MTETVCFMFISFSQYLEATLYKYSLGVQHIAIIGILKIHAENVQLCKGVIEHGLVRAHLREI